MLNRRELRANVEQFSMAELGMAENIVLGGNGTVILYKSQHRTYHARTVQVASRMDLQKGTLEIQTTGFSWKGKNGKTVTCVHLSSSQVTRLSCRCFDAG